MRKSSSVALMLLLLVVLLRLPRLEIELCEKPVNRRSVQVGVDSGVGSPVVTGAEDDLYEMLLLLGGGGRVPVSAGGPEATVDCGSVDSLIFSTGRERRGVGEGVAVLWFITVALEVMAASGARASNLRLDRLGDNGVGRLCEGELSEERLSGVKDSGRRLRCGGRGRALRLRIKPVVGVVGVGGARGRSESSSSSSSSTRVPNKSLDIEGLKESRFTVFMNVPEPGGKEGLVALKPVRENRCKRD